MMPPATANNDSIRTSCFYSPQSRENGKYGENPGPTDSFVQTSGRKEPLYVI